jgi:hypothetical protein
VQELPSLSPSEGAALAYELAVSETHFVPEGVVLGCEAGAILAAAERAHGDGVGSAACAAR